MLYDVQAPKAKASKPRKAKAGAKAPAAAPKVKKPRASKKVEPAPAPEPLPTAVAPLATAENIADTFDDLAGMVEPSRDQLTIISSLSAKYMENEEKLQGLDNLMAAIKQEQHRLTTKDIPDAMAAAGMESITDKDGNKVEIKEFLNGKLPSDPFKRKQALEFVAEEGGSAMIKRVIAVEFDKGDVKKAASVATMLKKAGVDFVDKEDIHTQTYLAFMRELLRDGRPVPLEDLGLFAGRAAKIKPPKKKLPKFGMEVA